MPWQWPRGDPKILAGFVNPEAGRLLPPLPFSTDDLRRFDPNNRVRRILQAVYETLAAQGIYYELDQCDPVATATQIVRQPEEVLAHKRGTCLDLAALFCGVCLTYEVIPVLLVTEDDKGGRHAFAVVSLTHELRDCGDSSRRLYADLADNDPRKPLFADTAALRDAVARGTYLAIECTGFAVGEELSAPTGFTREDGRLSFDGAVAAGDEQLRRGRLVYALDVAVAQALWRIPVAPLANYRGDWERLDSQAREAMTDVRCSVGSLPTLQRTDEMAKVTARLAGQGFCFIVGESGSGKSAIAKTAAEGYDRVVWPTGDLLDSSSLVELQGSLGLRNTIGEVLRTAAGPSLLVLDGLEGYSERALRLAARLIKEARTGDRPGGTRLLLVAQAEAARRVVDRLVELGVDRAFLDPLAINRPTEDQVGSMLAGAPQLGWAALRPELRPVLTNLKVLDWLVRAVQSGTSSMAPQEITGLTGLIERLWERWTDGAGGSYSRSGMLQKVGEIEAETLSAGVPVARLDHSERQTLPSLVTADMLKVRRDRVRFSHDLLGDWSRLRLLVSEGTPAVAMMRARAALPRWHRAIRLFGQSLLESGPAGAESWRREVERAPDGSDQGVILQDLLLESVVLSESAADTLRSLWPVLTAEDGKLLGRMLDRFLYVATVPDPRLAEFADDAAAVARLEHVFRIPFWPYWGPVLTVIHERNADVVRLVPLVAGRVCALWLRTMPVEVEPGRPLPYRLHAAQLAFALGSHAQERKAEGEYGLDFDEQAYEAALYAAPELPDYVSGLALKLAQRHESREDVQARREEAERESAESLEQLQGKDPERAQAIKDLCTPLTLGPLREPWPDGPRDRVEGEFRKVCLGTLALVPLMRVRPGVALEVLLAVCIEEPQHEDLFGHSGLEDVGVDRWQGGYPPFYARGPFLHFLREAPNEGLSFVLRVVNFATRRWFESESSRVTGGGIALSNGGRGATILIGGDERCWLGDERVFAWSMGWSAGSNVVTCALMALEKWLHETADAGQDIGPTLQRILGESESVAFLGLLASIGKRNPALFEGVLRPVLGVWQLYLWDHQVKLQQGGLNPSLIPWAMERGAEAKAAREWHALPHRSIVLIELAERMLALRPEIAAYFAERIADWRLLLDERGEPERLLLLTERLNRDNYQWSPQEDGSVAVTFEWPEPLRSRNEQDLRRVGANMALLMFPMQCRQRLDNGTPLQEIELPGFWDAIQGYSRMPPPQATADDPSPICLDDSVSGGIAVLIAFHLPWLRADQQRMDWCRAYMDEVIGRAPRRAFDCPEEAGTDRWDCFLAECGVRLLVEDRSDSLARKLVAHGVASYHYGTTALAMARGFGARATLGDDFGRMQTLAIRWAGVRMLLARAGQLQFDFEAWAERAGRLIGDFIDGTMPASTPRIGEVNDEGVAALEDLHSRQFPGRASQASQGGEEDEEEIEIRCRIPGLDLKVIESAFAWLDFRLATDQKEREDWLALTRGLLGLMLWRLPPVTPPRRHRIEGFPCEFDARVYRLVAQAIVRATDATLRRSLWQPVLDLDPAAHHWVEHFFWGWFTDGVEAMETPEAFVRDWMEMVEYATTSPRWDPDVVSEHTLDDMVFQLLGFYWGVRTVAGDARFTIALTPMAEVYTRASARWLSMPKVTGGFARFLAGPASERLHRAGIICLHGAAQAFTGGDWRERDLERDLMSALQAAWERQREAITSDQELRTAFLGLINMLASRNSYAAIALRDRVLSETGGIP